MNKKLFLGMFAAAGMLLATSCSNDELDMVQSGNEAQVTFSLGLEGGIATRAAISDGTGAKKLVYAVYKLDADGTPVLQNVVGSNNEGQFVDTEAFDGGLTETVSVTLAKGQTYQVAFWAQNPNCNAYTTTDLTNVEVSYNQATNNNDVRDAFFKTVEFTVSGNQTIDVELKRPFAQINVGVYKTDWEAAVKSGIEIEKSSVVIKDAATSINLLTGEVGDETTDVEVSYLSNTIPNEDLKVDLNGDKDYDDENEKYKWLSMSYILVADRNADSGNGVLGDERDALESLQYTFSPKSGNEITFGDGLNSVPVQRNWRTNILGQILTGNIEFNIRINPIFDGDINVDAPTSEVKSDAQTLAAALTANEEDILVVLGADVDLPISSLGSQTSGSGEYKLGGADTKNITIDLNGKTLNFTTSYMSAIGANNPDATITIKNGTVTSTGNSATTWNINDVTFANCNYVIENVTFNKEVALTNAGKSVTMNDVTINGTGDYYALWISAKGQTVKVDNLKINTSGRGIKIDEQYVGAPAKVTLDISNSTFKTAKKAAIMVKSVEGADINASNININEVATDNVHAVWVDADAAAYADKVVVTGAKKMVEISGNAGLNDALTNATEGSTIVLAKGEDYGTITIGELKNVTIKGGTMIFKTDANTKIENVTLQNVDFEYTGNTADCGIVVNENAQIDHLVLEGCTFTGTGAKAGRGLSGMNNNASIEIKNCTFKDLGYPVYAWGGYEALTIEDCTFENIKSWAIMPQSGFDGDLTVTSCTFKDCLGGGLIKAGTLTVGHTFTFTNNIITGCTIAGDHNWFQFNVSAGTSVISGNTKDGVDWTPSAADGVV